MSDNTLALAKEHSFGIIPIRLTLPNSLQTKPTASNTQVLLIHQRSRIPEYPVFWTFPKGHTEPEDASPLATAIRELKEETGLILKEENVLFIDSNGLDLRKGISDPQSLTAGSFVERYTNPIKNWTKEVRYWVGVVDNLGDGKVVVQEKEVADARWLSWNEALEIFTFVEGREILKRVIALLDGHTSLTLEV
jgi:bis(5'-nucleosidyl)-tetraphosphatase